MTQSRLADSSWLKNYIGIAKAVFLPSLLILSGTAAAEQAMSTETIAVPQEATELRIYKQRFEITADVFCRVPKKGPSYCNTNIGSEISYQVQPEMILKYKSVRLDEQEFAAEVTPQGALQFRTNKVDYSGSQTFEVEIIYLK